MQAIVMSLDMCISSARTKLPSFGLYPSDSRKAVAHREHRGRVSGPLRHMTHSTTCTKQGLNVFYLVASCIQRNPVMHNTRSCILHDTAKNVRPYIQSPTDGVTLFRQDIPPHGADVTHSFHPDLTQLIKSAIRTIAANPNVESRSSGNSTGYERIVFAAFALSMPFSRKHESFV